MEITELHLGQPLDLLAAVGQDFIEPTRAVSARSALYSDYLPTATVLAGVKPGQLHQGHFNANPYNYLIHINVLVLSLMPVFNMMSDGLG
ncbi:hypothetical protein NEOLEDRAFT_1136883 [Neolentinus lepideus HHB14362 ss-1]|uniref:Uncharacterized protein n=1 Tax=Neolentinus lepideus HHB14362 ss-1 TaxID=1314782 RepID=A0A165R2Y5_9AGAM|nr:hypothetical protein NEOLEDRAFT_1136883 [Neolentinus lepideus HHB14362 ss-1]